MIVVTALTGFALSRSVADGVTVAHVAIESPQGEMVPALWVSPRRPTGTALLAHGITASKETMLRLAESLAMDGFECCVIDFPGHGDSQASFTTYTVEDALVAGALALDARSGEHEPPQVDVFVGHSFGAGRAAMAVDAGAFSPRLFVAVGALPDLDAASRPEHVLFVTGRFEELFSTRTASAHADRLAAALVVVPWSDHVLVPFDGRTADAVVSAARRSLKMPPDGVAETGGGRSAAHLRLLGCLLLLGAGLAAALLRVRRGVSGSWAFAAGALVGGAVVASLVVGLHGWWLFLAPTPSRIALSLVCILMCLTGAVGLHRLVQRSSLLRDRTWAVYALGVVLAVVPGLSFAVTDQRFAALVSGLLVMLLLAGSTLGMLTRRRTGSDVAGYTAFAVVVGYIPGVWFGGLL